MARATEGRLAHLHNLMTEAMIDTLDDCKANDLPVSPQLFSAIGKFLKDNEITCSIETGSSTGELQERMASLRNNRRRIADTPVTDEVH